MAYQRTSPLATCVSGRMCVCPASCRMAGLRSKLGGSRSVRNWKYTYWAPVHVCTLHRYRLRGSRPRASTSPTHLLPKVKANWYSLYAGSSPLSAPPETTTRAAGHSQNHPYFIRSTLSLLTYLYHEVYYKYKKKTKTMHIIIYRFVFGKVYWQFMFL